MSKARVISFFILSLFVLSCNKTELTGSEETQIETYIKNKGLVITEKTASGLRYIQTKAGTPVALKAGQTINVNYAGRLLTDKQFDAGNFSFKLGVGQVVGGFDEGIAKMKVGEKATIIFPSSLGYGSAGAGKDIPGNSPLLFDIEVISAK